MCYTHKHSVFKICFSQKPSFLLWFLESQNFLHLGFSVYKELEFIGEPLWEATMLFYIFLMFSSMSIKLHLHSQIRGHSFTWNFCFVLFLGVFCLFVSGWVFLCVWFLFLIFFSFNENENSKLWSSQESGTLMSGQGTWTAALGTHTPRTAEHEQTGSKPGPSSQGFKKPACDLSHQAKQMLLFYYISKFLKKTNWVFLTSSSSAPAMQGTRAQEP